MGEWHEEKLEDCLERLIDYRGKSPTKSPTGIPVLSAKVVKTAGLLHPIEQTISEEYYPKWMVRGFPRAGDIVLTTEGPMGEVIQLDEQTATYALGQRIVCLRAKQDVLDNGFLRYLLISPRQQDILTSFATGTTVLGISQKALRSVPIRFPPLPEQRAIASVLCALDDKIALNWRMNETLEGLARALFKDWFVDFGPTRAKASGAKPYLPPEIWSLFPDRLDDNGVPEGWEEKPLDEIAEFLNGLALQKYPAGNDVDYLPVIKIAELRNGISAKTNKASREVPEKYVVRDGDFIFSWSGSLLAKFWTGGEGALNQHLFKVSSKNYPAWFYSQWVLHHLEEFQGIAKAKATTMGHIQRGHLKAAKTICPPSDVLEVLGDMIEPLVTRAIKNELESRTLAQTRDLLLPKLMSGALRVGAAEKIAEGAL